MGAIPGVIEMDGALLRLRAAPSFPERMPSAFALHAHRHALLPSTLFHRQ